VDARQQVGSSFKPVGVYAPACELGVISPATVIKDMPLRYTENSAFPNNAERYYVGSKTVLGGVVSSVNAVAVNTLDMIGTRYSYNFAKEKFRISGLVENGPNGTTDVDYSPLGLGGLSVGASVRDMAGAYATFANQGVYREGRTYTKVYDSQGNLILDNTQDSEKILSQKTVDYMNYCLDEAVRRGTGNKADFDGMDICGKTGTTNSNKVRYFCGYTGHYTAAVWCGYEIPAQIQLVGDGTNPAIRLWKKVMEPIHKGKDRIPMYNSDNMVEITVCLDSGKLVTDACTHDIRDMNRVESVLVYPEDIPEEYCDKHIALEYCSDGKAVANEYCKKFAAVGKLELTGTGLVKLTQNEVDERIKAGKYGLKKEYLNSKYVYLIDQAGEPAGFKGFNDELDGSGPCIYCTKHTQEAWEQFKANNPWVDTPNIQDPVDPGDPEDPDDPIVDSTEPTDSGSTEEEDKNWLDKIKDFFQGAN
jgi:penicillin-binding protein 1A